jgi:hypothetical protein
MLLVSQPAQKAHPPESEHHRVGIHAPSAPQARLRRDRRDDQTRARRDPRQALENRQVEQSRAHDQRLSRHKDRVRLVRHLRAREGSTDS